MTFLFYVSGHGFGHASRQVEVINSLNRAGRHRILIRSDASAALFARTVPAPYELLPGACDTGVAQRTSLRHDDAETVDTALRFYRHFPARVKEETARLLAGEVDVIVGDIPPLAFEVAARLGVPSVAVGNFTWDWIYETHPEFLPRGQATLQTIRSAYRKATRALRLPLSAGFEVFPRVTRVPLIARRPTRTRISTRRHFGLDPQRRVALLSFGGYGLPELDLSQLDCTQDWTVVTTATQPDTGASTEHVRVVSEAELTNTGFRYEDLVAASDVVVTKPGYGIIAECAAARTAMLYTSRGAFREYDMLVRGLPEIVRSLFISQADLLAGRWRASLDAVLTYPAPPETIAVNGADVVAGLLEEVARR